MEHLLLHTLTTVTGKGFSTSNEKYEWWLNELRSLGIAVHQRDEFNGLKEISSLADNLKIITILIPEISHCSDSCVRNLFFAAYFQ